MTRRSGVERARRPRPVDPVLGWRLWRLRDGRLCSWSCAFTWAPGENDAHCLAQETRHAAPARRCLCGFWALFSPLRAIGKARSEPERLPVLGLVRGWGEIALHGEEGFRAQHASVACVFTDWVWDAAVMPRPDATVPALIWEVRRRLLPAPRAPEPEPELRRSLPDLAASYGVPVLGLRDAVRYGVLEEMGADASMLREARCWLAAPRAS